MRSVHRLDEAKVAALDIDGETERIRESRKKRKRIEVVVIE